MTKIAHFGDLHLDKGNRFEDTLECFQRGIDNALKEDVDLFVIAGDIYNQKSQPEERNAFAQKVITIAERAPLVMIQGTISHDAPGDLDIFAELRGNEHIYIFSTPQTVALEDIPIIVNSLPYPRKSYFMGNGKNMSIQESNEQVRESLLQILRGFAAKRVEYPDIPSILIGHVNIVGSRASTGQTMIGNEIELSPQDLAAAGADAYLLAHIHKHQEIVASKLGKAAYCGSINRMNFGEEEEKGYLLWTVEKGHAEYEFRNIYARRMFSIETEWNEVEPGGMHTWLREYDSEQMKEFVEADVRFRYRIPENMKSEVDESEVRESFNLAIGKPHSLKIERILIPTTRIRSEKIAKAKTIPEKLEAYWETNERPDEKTVEACLTKLAVMQTEPEEKIMEDIS